jgi:hypothetical protein
MATKIQNGGRKSKCKMEIFLVKNQLKSQISGKFKALFGFRTLSFDPKIILRMVNFFGGFKMASMSKMALEKLKNIFFCYQMANFQ